LHYELVDGGGEYPKSGEIEIVGEYSGDPRDFDEYYARAWMHVTPMPIREFLPNLDYKGFSLDTFQLEGDFWLEFDHGRFDITTEFNVPVLALNTGLPETVDFENITGLFRIIGTGPDDWRAYLNGLKLNYNGGQWTPGNIAAVTYKTVNNNNLLLHFGSLDVGYLADFGIEIGGDVIPERTVMMLQAMKPRGMLEDMYVYFRQSSEKPDFRFVGLFKSGNIEAYSGAPAVTNLDTIFSISPQETWLDLHSGAFSIGFESISDETWDFDSARGRLNFDYKQGFLRVGSGLLKMRKDDMVVSGKLQLNLTTDRRYQNWGLLIGIENGDISQKSLYLPNTLSDEVTEWLDEGLVSGILKDGGLLFHGSLSQDAEAIEKLYELYFNAENTTLNYHPDWPQLEYMNGLVNVGDWGVSSNQVTARLYDSQLKADVLMPFGASGQTSYVYMTGGLEGTAADGMKFINRTPIADMIDHLSDDWTTEGNITADLALKIPVSDAIDESGKPRYNFDGEVNTQMLGVNLYLPEYDLNIRNISSSVNYTVATGLSADQFDARLLGFPVRGNISTFYEPGSDQGQGHVLIDFEGKTSIEKLRDWTELTLLHLASGEFDYTASLISPFGEQAPDGSLRAESDLYGTEIQIPAPLLKLPEERVPFKYQSDFTDDGMKVRVDYANGFNAVLGMKTTIIERGSLIFGSARAKLPWEPGVEVHGALEKLDVNEWMRTYDRFTGGFEKSTYASFDEELESVIRLLELDVGMFTVEDIHFEDSKLRINRIEQAWKVDLVNPSLSGNVKFYDDENIPIDVMVDYLRLISEPGETDYEDPLAELTVSDLVPMIVQINEFSFDDENYGSWKFKLEPVGNHVKISDLYASVKGLEVGDENTGGGFAEWHFNGSHQTTKFDGIVRPREMAVALTEWGYAPSIEGEQFVFDMEIGWNGSPVMISKETVRGAIKVASRRGRFVQVTGAGAVKVLGIFDFAALARRFQFDFSDVLSKGFEFDKIRGEWWVDEAQLRVTRPITVEGSGSSFKAGGAMDLVTGDLDGDMIVTLEVSRNLPWYSAIVVSPMVGATVFLAQKVFQNQINQLSSAKYQVTGTVEEPIIEFVNIFDDSVREEKKPTEVSANEESQPVQALP
jgi:uncharacterized protein (TIGR02099 family)